MGDDLIEADKKGANARVARAIYREMRNRQAKAWVTGVLSRNFVYGRGAGQGPSEPPSIFAAGLDLKLAPEVEKWNRKGF